MGGRPQALYRRSQSIAATQDNTNVAITFGSNCDQTALPIRRWDATQSLMDEIPQTSAHRVKVSRVRLPSRTVTDETLFF